MLIGSTFSITGCLGRSDRPFVPQSVERNAGAEVTLSKLQKRINAKDPRGVCALYAYPSRRCVAIWRQRISVFPTPVRLTMRRLIFGCAGDARLLFVQSSRKGVRPRMLSLVSVKPRVYTAIIDMPMSNRRSSLVVPATGTCASEGDHVGGVGADNRDSASRGS